MKHYTTTHFDHLMYNKTRFPSWDEQIPAAFHQEPFGGFIWPPRSYTCTFCRRQFRSAQALGGHMNVHRRDRAKLKQSSPAQHPEPEVPHHPNRASDPCQETVSSGRHPWPLSPPTFADNDEDFVETKLTMSIDSVDFKNVVCKRYKKSSSNDISSPLPFMNSKLCLSDRCSVGSSMEDIDLELRLGDPPAVK